MRCSTDFARSDRVALLSFSTRVRFLAPLTASRQQIRGALATLEAHGATSLRDAAFAGLALREADPGTHAAAHLQRWCRHVELAEAPAVLESVETNRRRGLRRRYRGRRIFNARRCVAPTRADAR